MERLQEILVAKDMERVVYSIESLARLVGNANVADVLSSLVETARTLRGSDGASKDSGQPG